jgi:DNA-binding transcriptional LysR family regulator
MGELGVEIHQVRYFLRVAAVLNFTRASEELHISQPSLSRQIKLLEEELNAVLFERLPQGLKLTPAGQALVPHLSELLTRWEQTSAVVEGFSAGRRGRVTIGAVPSAATHFLPAVLSRFVQAYPEVETQVEVVATSDQVFRRLREGSIDLGICGGNDAELERMPLYEEQLLVAVPDGLRSELGETVSDEELGRLPFVATPRGCTVRHLLEEIDLNRVLEVQQLDTALQFVARGLGVTVVPESLAREGLRFLPLQTPRIHHMYAYWRPAGFLGHHHPLVKALQAQK